MKKTPGDTVILHKGTLNDNHMIYGCSDMKHHSFFCHFGPFLHFYPPNNTKNQNFEKREKIPGDIILHMCTINDNYMMYGS